MSIKKFTSNSIKETQMIAQNLAGQILQQKPAKKAVVLALYGDLGAGKTTFLQGFARGLGIKEKVTSPTFVILKKFLIPNSISTPIPNFSHVRKVGYRYFYHLDCYRLNTLKEMLDLGFQDIILSPENIVAIEWPERIKSILPKKIISIKFHHNKENQRKLTFRK